MSVASAGLSLNITISVNNPPRARRLSDLCCILLRRLKLFNSLHKVHPGLDKEAPAGGPVTQGLPWAVVALAYFCRDLLRSPALWITAFSVIAMLTMRNLLRQLPPAPQADGSPLGSQRFVLRASAQDGHLARHRGWRLANCANEPSLRLPIAHFTRYLRIFVLRESIF